MKPLLFLLTALLSLNLHAERDGVQAAFDITTKPVHFTSAGFMQSSFFSLIITNAPSKAQAQKLAQVIQNDSQEYFLTGTLSPFLEKQTELVIAQNPDLAENEAIAALNEWADSHL